MEQSINKHGVTITIFEDKAILLSGSVGESEIQLIFKDEAELKKKIDKKIKDITCIDLLNKRNEATKLK